MQPTQEQQAIIDAVVSGKSLKVQAYAGSGKTSLLVAVAQAIPDKSIGYVTFNKRLAEEAKTKFPYNADCRTAHSLAYGVTGKYFQRRLENSAYVLQNYYLHEASRLYTPSSDEDMDSNDLGLAALRVINSFLQSDSLTLDEQLGDSEQRSDILDVANAFWQMMSDYKGRSPVTHDVYLKLWELKLREKNAKPLKYDLVMFDEAQDASPVMLSVLKSHYHHGGQLIIVGDAYQQLYDWRGAVNAIQKFDLPEFPMSQSFRFGPKLAELAMRVLDDLGAKYQLKGTESIPTEVVEGYVPEGTTPKCVLNRTNIGVFNSILRFLDMTQLTIEIIGGTTEVIDEMQGLVDLTNKGFTKHTKFSMFRGFNHMRIVSNTEVGTEYRPYVKLMDNYGPDYLQQKLDALRQRSVQSGGEIVFSTIHKSKGLEFETVALGDDLKPWVVDEEVHYAEGCVVYVAMTRAIRTLYLDGFTAEYQHALDGGLTGEDE